MIEFTDVAFSYGGDDTLRDVSFRLDPGGFYFLTGPSGAGKTTLMRLCSLELMPTAGQVKIFGADATAFDEDGVSYARRRIGMVVQDCQFLDHLSLGENVALPLRIRGVSEEKYGANLSELMDWVGLTDRIDALPPELSGGERQRAAVARAVIGGPDLILADEPTGNVDWEMAERILGLLIALNRLGKTVLVTTHDLNLIRKTKSRATTSVLRLSQGQLSEAGATL